MNMMLWDGQGYNVSCSTRLPTPIVHPSTDDWRQFSTLLVCNSVRNFETIQIRSCGHVWVLPLENIIFPFLGTVPYKIYLEYVCMLTGVWEPVRVRCPQNSWTQKLLSVLSIYNNFRFILISKLVTETINVDCYFLREKAHWVHDSKLEKSIVSNSSSHKFVSLREFIALSLRLVPRPWCCSSLKSRDLVAILDSRTLFRTRDGDHCLV